MAFSRQGQKGLRFLMPPHIRTLSGDVQRPVQLAWIIAILTSLLSVIMVLDNNLNTLPPEFAEFTRISIILTAILCVIALSGLICMALNLLLAGRLLIMLYAIGLVCAMTRMMGLGTGADIVGAIVLAFSPALIFSPSERLMTGLAALTGALAMVGVQASLHLYGPLFVLPAGELIIIRYSVVAVGICIGLFIVFLHYSAEMAKTALMQEKERSEALLLNILPMPVAERLKAGETPIADGLENVSVLFADIVGFTALSARRSPAELVTMLDSVFRGFDAIAARHGVEKIKTIGDGYLAVGGLSNLSPEEKTSSARHIDHAVNVACMALEMMQFMQDFREASGLELNLRVGLHCGPVVAGVIGQHKFAYDLWGDTVNLASRMESGSQPGRITISGDMQNMLSQQNFGFEDRGEIPVKGKGMVHAFFLLPAPRPEDMDMEEGENRSESPEKASLLA